jgi:hypothetical protein
MQRSRANWLQYGDRNTNFFHQYASARRKKNLIKKLKNNNEWVEGTAALKPVILDYFANMFTSEVHQVDPELLEKIQPKVTAIMMACLRSLHQRKLKKQLLALVISKHRGQMAYMPFSTKDSGASVARLLLLKFSKP